MNLRCRYFQWRWRRFFDRADAAPRRLRRHLNRCPACRAEVESLDAVLAVLEQSRATYRQWRFPGSHPDPVFGAEAVPACRSRPILRPVLALSGVVVLAVAAVWFLRHRPAPRPVRTVPAVSLTGAPPAPPGALEPPPMVLPAHPPVTLTEAMRGMRRALDELQRSIERRPQPPPRQHPESIPQHPYKKGGGPWPSGTAL